MRSFKKRSTPAVSILAIVLSVILIVSLFVGCSDFQINRSMRLVRKAAIAEITDHYTNHKSLALVKDSISIGSIDVTDSGYTCIVYGMLSVTDKYGAPKPDIKFRIVCKLIDGKWTVADKSYTQAK